MRSKVIIGTRGSMLALKQTELMRKALSEKFREIEFEIKVISTSGDIRAEKNFSEISQKKLFVKEIEEELLNGKIDIAVHSMKDMAAEDTDGLITVAVTKREDARDVLLTKMGGIKDLPTNAVIGTGSARRRVQIKQLLGEIEVHEIRGNIDTRIRKMTDGKFDGIILAAAGLSRGGVDYAKKYFFNVDEMVPAPGQGALGIQCRKNDEFIKDIGLYLECSETRTAVTAEREFSKILNGGCKTPLGAYAEIIGNELVLSVMIEESGEVYKEKVTGSTCNPEEVGRAAAEIIRKRMSMMLGKCAEKEQKKCY